ncbi:hypothetical protein IJG21_02300 [Candidatus Saccharibacteria bacterium]|nr:hypothetical protein [Candidatus Saccharibacteria bacterium]
MAKEAVEEIEKLARERKIYRGKKKTIMEKEAMNYDKVVIFQSVRGYWVAVDHSAVILALVLAKPAKLRARLIHDNDFQKKSKLGMVSIRNIESYKVNLPKTNMCRLIYDEKGYVVFQLTKPLSKEEFEIIVKDEENKRRFLRDEVLQVCPLPKSLARVREVLIDLYKFSKKQGLEKEAKQYTAEAFQDLYRAYLELLKTCRVKRDLKGGVAAVLDKIEDTEIKLMALSELEIIPVEKATVFYSKTVDLIHTLRKEAQEVNKRKDPRNGDKN